MLERADPCIVLIVAARTVISGMMNAQQPARFGMASTLTPVRFFVATDTFVRSVSSHATTDGVACPMTRTRSEPR
ncbi:hypothetical protein Mal65_25640 [Crateriforma conspicua]|nr:hypothetical protein Mal65_25640 [Crateriforma conspicua]